MNFEFRLRELWMVFVLLCTVVQGAWAQKEPVTYLERSWDNKDNIVVEETKTCSDYMEIDNQNCNNTGFGYKYKDRATPTWYVVKKSINMRHFAVSGEVHLILCDGVEVRVPGITVTTDKGEKRKTELHIHSQSNKTGQGKLITVATSSGVPGIGTLPDSQPGVIVIHGGDITARGAKGAAGIGGAACTGGWLPVTKRSYAGDVIIYGGKIDSRGGENGAGIGGGSAYRGVGCHAGTVTIYGGEITAVGGELAAGVGGGGNYNKIQANKKDASTFGGVITIYDGVLTAQGGHRAAGIGAGNAKSGGKGADCGTLLIYGGSVKANGGAYGAGIGGGCNGHGYSNPVLINGGTVYATGGKDAAGIGGGEDGRVGKLTVSGGFVRAEGKGGSAGIGAGDGNKMWIELHETKLEGGKVIAVAGEDCKGRVADKGGAIGYAKGKSGKGHYKPWLHIGDHQKVTAGDSEFNLERTFTTPERRDACLWRNVAIIEPCEHKESKYIYIDEKKHYRQCTLCNYKDEEVHTLKLGEDCICGKKFNNETDARTVATYESADGKTYATGEGTTVLTGKEFVLPKAKDVEGLIFMGWIESSSKPSSIEMTDTEFSDQKLVSSGTLVVANENLKYYARYRYNFNTEWNWNDEGTEASVTLSSPIQGISNVTLKATVTEDTEEFRPATETELGRHSYMANVTYTTAPDVTYNFSDSYSVDFFDQIGVDLDALAEGNEETIEEYDDKNAGIVTIRNLTLKKDGKLHPLCLPFSLEKLAGTPLAGAKLYYVDNYEITDGLLKVDFKLQTEDGIMAGEPYFVKWDSGTDIESPTFQNTWMKDEIWYAGDFHWYLSGTFGIEATDKENGGVALILEDGKLIEPEDGLVDAFSNFFYIYSDKAEDGGNVICSVRLSFENDITVEKHLAYPWEGAGTEESPYIIKSVRQLNDLASAFNASDDIVIGKYFKQGANITFDKTVENNYKPINAFKGHYDGAGFTISGVNMNMTEGNNASLFGTMEDNSTVKNLIVAASTFKGHNAAPIAGFTTSTASVENCHVLKDVTVEAITANASGVVANVYDGSTVKQSTSQAAVKGKVYAGGIAGYMVGGSILGCTYLGNSVTCGEGQLAKAGAVLGLNSSLAEEKVENCYFTSPTLSDNLAKLMPQYNKDIDNTDFLTRLHERDEFLLSAGLTKEQIGYDITMNNRKPLAATQQADGTWKSKAYSACLPFNMSIPSELQENIKVYKLHEVDIDNKVLQFTNEFPILIAGEPYIIVVTKGSLSLGATNTVITAYPREPLIVKNADASKEMGWWCGTFKKLDNNSLLEKKAYFLQPNGTYRCSAEKYPSCYINPFVGYFSSMESLNFEIFQLKYIPTENGEETEDVTDFPADEFDCDYDLGDEITDIKTLDTSNFKHQTSNIYDLQGRRLNGKPNKGIYIQRGKKIANN